MNAHLDKRVIQEAGKTIAKMRESGDDRMTFHVSLSGHDPALRLFVVQIANRKSNGILPLNSMIVDGITYNIGVNSGENNTSPYFRRMN